MDFKKLANQYKDELLDNVLPFGSKTRRIMNMVVISLVLIVKEKFSIRINSFGCKVEKYGCSLCSTIK